MYIAPYGLRKQSQKRVTRSLFHTYYFKAIDIILRESFSTIWKQCHSICHWIFPCFYIYWFPFLYYSQTPVLEKLKAPSHFVLNVMVSSVDRSPYWIQIQNLYKELFCLELCHLICYYCTSGLFIIINHKKIQYTYTSK